MMAGVSYGTYPAYATHEGVDYHAHFNECMRQCAELATSNGLPVLSCDGLYGRCRASAQEVFRSLSP